MKRLAIITTHPIQYYAPVFKLLHQRGNIMIKVFYTLGAASATTYDHGFGKTVNWDIPLLDGYNYEWVNNISANPGSHHFNGIINPELTSRIMEWHPDAVLIYGWAYQSHLKAIRHFKNKVPTYFRGDSTLLNESKGIKKIVKYIFLKWVYKHIDHAFFTGKNNKAYFLKYGLKEEQLSFAPHAIDNDRFSEARCNEVDALKNDLKINNEDILIAYAGKFEEKKDPLLLADAFKQLKQDNCHLLFVGNGPLENVLKQKIRNLKNIHIMDFQNQSYMPVIFQSCDLFCLPSKGPGESWGLAVNEAMACEKAILVSDKVGCASDLVKQNFNGNIFKSGDQTSLLEYLTKLTQTKPTLKEYGKNSGIIIRDWSFTKIAEAIENKLK